MTTLTEILRTLKPSLYYATIVFGVGFVLGSIRVFFVVPKVGMRWAELLEAPLMLFVSFLAARVITRLFGPFTGTQSLTVGGLALTFMALAEITFVLAQGYSIRSYVASRDPISGTVYLLSLGVFAAMPLLVRVRRN